MYGVYLAHKVGDLVRVSKYDFGTYLGSYLGVVAFVPENYQQESLFIKVYVFKTNKEEWIPPSEIDIISNIDE